MAQQPVVRGVGDVAALVDTLGRLTGRSRFVWFLVFGGLFLDAYSNVFGCAVLTGAGAVVDTAAVRPGESVVVYGLGGVGLSAVLGGRGLADRRGGPGGGQAGVGAAARRPPRLPARRGGGGGAFADRRRGGVAVEAVGSAAVIGGCLSAVDCGGRVVPVGLPAPDRTLGAVPALAFAGEGKSLIGSYMGDSVPRRDIPRYLGLWRSGAMPVEWLHSGTVPLDGLDRALEDLAGGRAVRQLVHPAD
ncbi:MDR/zinc-dependent alcohol dehydrogenase-like family protein [Streptantibioticus cattleyicolor]|uniref:Zinc-containing alcohol dehydrogenase n=1 Tax=Streptantibioticus cattleyicolor (strain ATCC 35852 / DSM 46488 / JCM 4925 / NBRC 14057 / NRRL 8057) TaxID=1003195 RepID=F8JM59_STREN